MQVSSQLFALATLPRGKLCGPQKEKQSVRCPYRESNPCCPARHLITIQ